jgi:hypothetical protein
VRASCSSRSVTRAPVGNRGVPEPNADFARQTPAKTRLRSALQNAQIWISFRRRWHPSWMVSFLASGTPESEMTGGRRPRSPRWPGCCLRRWLYMSKALSSPWGAPYAVKLNVASSETPGSGARRSGSTVVLGSAETTIRAGGGARSGEERTKPEREGNGR